MAKRTSKKKELAEDRSEEVGQQAVAKDVESVVLEEGDIYRLSDPVYAKSSTYIYLGGSYYGLNPYTKNVEKLPKEGYTYLGNLEDFRPSRYRGVGFSDSDCVQIEPKRTGCIYEYWYKVGIVSEDEKARKAFEEFFKTIPGFVLPTKDPQEQPWWKRF